MNLFQALAQLPASQEVSGPIPDYLYGAFRRKSISFSNGLTDEKTIVYWFQSRSFTIDLRLKCQENTPVNERQGWVGNTLWDAEQQLLSWDVEAHSNYQNHVQWPEPAKLHAIGNCILEFSPSNAYVEDWRQQVHEGLFLGLRLMSALDVESHQLLQIDGGLIICDKHVAFAMSRLPVDQQTIASINISSAPAGYETLIESFEVSIAVDGLHKYYTTTSSQQDQALNFDHFEIIDETHLMQNLIINGQAVQLMFEVDIYVPHYAFQHRTDTTTESADWLRNEKQHLLHHAVECL
ncbi:hypothetical protein M5F00_12825 [Acinetobacter sp. ANC 4945]|uniref:Uncharacterized protein n=1 Tax=Acinetobacter amyesii TaxID=2942470 RepID=A0A1T1GTI8_9GAMM|nr:hypothetical protein [Acinetobacter amyesii]MCL6248745.1 hypothetical protein [Acinetobacter amyesii]OOV80795.1 hypothetical protein B1202_12330 [Acinetobacter amyesii]